jgi:hypothetical protein
VARTLPFMPTPNPDTLDDLPVPEPDTPAAAAWRNATPRRLLAALGALGMVMVATPLAEVLRRQAEDLTRLQDAAQRVVPLQANVGVQRALLDHHLLAAVTLGGQPERESERQAQQAVVGVQIDTLQLALTQAREPEALAEHGALREDWRTLAARLEARRIDAPTNLRSHRLLIDQSIQIGDLLGGGQEPGATVGRAGTGAEDRRRSAATDHLAWQALPRLDHALAIMAAGGTSPDEAAAILRASWRQVERLAAAAGKAPAAMHAAGRPDEAAAEWMRALRPWLERADGHPDVAGAPAQDSLAPARQAVRTWADRAQQAAAADRVQAAAAAAAVHRYTIGGAAGALLAYALLAWAVARRLARAGSDGLPPTLPPVAPFETPVHGADTPRTEAARLLGRLRGAETAERKQPLDRRRDRASSRDDDS